MAFVALSSPIPEQDYLDALASGASVLVRTATAYPGDERVVRAVAALTGAPLAGTDLVGPVRLLTDPVGSGPAVLAYRTSGTTGAPKTVVYEVDRVWSHADAIASVLGLDPARRHLALTPPTYAYGLSVRHSHARAGVPVEFLPGPHTPLGLAAALAEGRAPITLYCLPQQASLLVAAPALGRLDRLVVAGGRLADPVCRALAARVPGLTLTSMFGQAELGPRLAVWSGPAADFRAGALGAPMPGVRLRVGPDGVLQAATPWPAGWIVGPGAAEITPGAVPGEFVRTGDLAHVDADGELHHVGRVGSFANVAGTRLDLGELAATAEAVLPVLTVRAGKRPAAAGDDIPVLELVPADPSGLTPVQVRRALAGTLGSLAGLLDIRVVDHLTVGEAGK